MHGRCVYVPCRQCTTATPWEALLLWVFFSSSDTPCSLYSPVGQTFGVLKEENTFDTHCGWVRRGCQATVAWVFLLLTGTSLSDHHSSLKKKKSNEVNLYTPTWNIYVLFLPVWISGASSKPTLEGLAFLFFLSSKKKPAGFQTVKFCGKTLVLCNYVPLGFSVSSFGLGGRHVRTLIVRNVLFCFIHAGLVWEPICLQISVHCHIHATTQPKSSSFSSPVVSVSLFWEISVQAF